jgi:hypothetical protein
MDKTLTETVVASLFIGNEKVRQWTIFNPYEIEEKNIIKVGLSPAASNIVYIKIR